MIALETLYEDSKLKISKKDGGSDKVFLCFSGLRPPMGLINLQDEEFVKVRNDATAIFIIDKVRSWGNIDWDQVIKIASPYLINKRVFTIGNSMGGYCAILASRHFLIEKVIAFVPQYSVHKSIVPLERRWDVDKTDMTGWKYISLEGSFDDNTEYHIFYGSDEDEIHRKLFPKQKNIKIYIYEGDHALVQILKSKGILYDLISDIVNAT